jgi:DNA repair photolyase
VRWGNLQYDQEPTGDGAGQLPLFGLESVARTFDTPEFKGMTFYEVQAKSIINRVPGESRVPFSWTINPYRGCSHACVYCLSGDTRILLADGTTKPLAFLEVGDAVIGTVPGGRRRQTVVTHVLGHWSTMKSAYRIRVDDGRQLVASGDHRLLTDRGWAQVAPDDEAEGEVGPGDRYDRPRPLAEGSILLGSDITDRTSSTELIGRPITPSAGGVVMSVEPLGPERAMFDISTGTGDFIANGLVSHNCFARNTHEYLDLDSGADFDRKVIVKVNAPELLRRELRKPSWSGEPIAMGTNVDCYQRAEGRYQLMRGILSELRKARNPFSILTKGTLVLRDLDLLQEAAGVTDVSLNISVGSVDRELWRSVEPGTPSPQARLGICRTLADEGLSCGVLMAPILPYLSDSPRQLDETVRAIADSGARSISPIVLHLRPGAREWYAKWLAREHPTLVPRYRELYGNRSYAPTSYQRRIADHVGRLAHRYGMAA